MKVLLSLGLAAIITLLATISYQIERAGWSDMDKQCSGIFVPDAQRQQCELDYHLNEMNRSAAAAVLGR